MIVDAFLNFRVQILFEDCHHPRIDQTQHHHPDRRHDPDDENSRKAQGRRQPSPEAGGARLGLAK